MASDCLGSEATPSQQFTSEREHWSPAPPGTPGTSVEPRHTDPPKHCGHSCASACCHNQPAEPSSAPIHQLFTDHDADLLSVLLESEGESPGDDEAAGAHVDNDDDEEECCWICLQSDGDLCSPCKCPRKVHQTCLARWQLQQHGGREERHCRFCSQQLPDWTTGIVPAAVKPAPYALIVVVGPDGSRHRVPLRPGLAGRREFTRTITQLLKIPRGAEVQFDFTVAVPGTGDAHKIQTQDFHVVSRLATINAGIRNQQQQQQQQQQQSQEQQPQPQPRQQPELQQQQRRHPQAKRAVPPSTSPGSGAGAPEPDSKKRRCSQPDSYNFFV